MHLLPYLSTNYEHNSKRPKRNLEGCERDTWASKTEGTKHMSYTRDIGRDFWFQFDNQFLFPTAEVTDALRSYFKT